MKKKENKVDLNEQLTMPIEEANTEQSVDFSAEEKNVITSNNDINEQKNVTEDIPENNDNLNTNNTIVKKNKNAKITSENKKTKTTRNESDQEYKKVVAEAIAKEKLREAEETQNPKKKAKSVLINSLMLALNIFIMFFIINSFLKSTEGSDFSLVSQAQGGRLWWLALALGCYIIMLSASTINYYILIKNTSGLKNLYLAYRVAIIGKYYDNITPFAVGGQPFQIVTMSKAGVKPGTATSIPITKLIVYNITVSLFALIAFIFGIPNLPITTPLNSFLQVLIKICGVIGLIISVFVVVVLLLLGSRRIVGKSFSRWLVRLGYKLRIVKDYRKSFEKFNNQVIEYQNSTSYLGRNKGVMFMTILLCVIENLAISSIPFAIVMAFSGIEITCFAEFFHIWGICVVLYYICSMATAGIPLPGGTGMMELSFILFFGISSLIGGINIVWGLLFYRVFSYYIIIAHGFTQTVIDSSVSIAKNRTKEVKE